MFDSFTTTVTMHVSARECCNCPNRPLTNGIFLFFFSLTPLVTAQGPGGCSARVHWIVWLVVIGRCCNSHDRHQSCWLRQGQLHAGVGPVADPVRHGFEEPGGAAGIRAVLLLAVVTDVHIPDAIRKDALRRCPVRGHLGPA